jgi:hypothetical protein
MFENITILPLSLLQTIIIIKNMFKKCCKITYVSIQKYDKRFPVIKSMSFKEYVMKVFFNLPNSEIIIFP